MARKDGPYETDVSIESSDIDPITFTVLWDRLVAICDEMGTTLQRTGKSEAVSAGQDFSTALFDRSGRLVAQGNFSPGHLGSMPFAVENILDRFSLEEFEPGDGVLLNDSRLGSGHLPDFFLVTPIFVDDAIEAFGVNVAHQIDVGGLAPGSQAVEATEVYQEGLRLLPTKVIEGGEIREWFLDLLRANVRIPDIVIGDFKAQHNANHRGSVLVKELFEEYDRDVIYTCMDELLSQSEKRVRRAIRDMPDGEYSFEDIVDNVGVDTDSVRVCVTVTIDGDEMVFDYSNSDPQTESAINSHINYTRAYTVFVFKSITDKFLHQNEGVIRPLTIKAPEGNFFNPTESAAAGARPVLNTRIVDINMGALSEAIPEKVIAASSHWGNPNFGGVDPETEERFVIYDLVVGGVGASQTKDGAEGISSSFNLTNIPVEIHENRYPVRIEVLQLMADSGGAGRNRGGLGVRKDFTLLADDVRFTNLTDRTDSRPWGLFGGEPGDPAQTILNPDGEAEPLHSKGSYTLDCGDTVSFRVSGSGGFGNPLDRDPERVRRDVEKGYVSPRNARNEYGVVIEDAPSGVIVDRDATKTKRKRLRQK